MSEEENRGKGRPSAYKPEYAELARKFCLLGATDVMLAEFFEVSETTINNWKNEHSDFLVSIKSGKDQADAEVADRLFQRAKGYEHPEVDIRAVNGEIVQTPITKIYAPDTTAAIFWLKNRQPKSWRDKQEVEHSGSIDSKVSRDMSDDELEKVIAERNARST